jgi:hypothetical protein
LEGLWRGADQHFRRFFGECYRDPMIDGHEDAWPPELSETGEASDSELAIALGRVDERLPSPLDELTRLVDPEHVALLAPRDATAVAEGGTSSVRPDVACFLDDREVRGKGASRWTRLWTWRTSTSPTGRPGRAPRAATLACCTSRPPPPGCSPRQNVSAPLLMAISGHKRLATLQRYVNPSQAAVAMLIAATDPDRRRP